MALPFATASQCIGISRLKLNCAFKSGWSKHGKAEDALAGTNRVYIKSSRRLSDKSPAVNEKLISFSPRISNSLGMVRWVLVCSTAAAFPLTTRLSIWLISSVASRSRCSVVSEIWNLISSLASMGRLLWAGIAKSSVYLVFEITLARYSARSLEIPGSENFSGSGLSVSHDINAMQKTSMQMRKRI